WTRRERKHGATAARDPLRQRTKPKSTETALLTLRHVAMHITPMDSQTLTLRELSDQVGIEPRTIRSYIQQGLLRGPEGLGPKAKYGPYHLGRLRAIKVLKESEGKSLAEIRMLLVSAPDGEVDAIAARFRETPEGAAPPVTG